MGSLGMHRDKPQLMSFRGVRTITETKRIAFLGSMKPFSEVEPGSLGDGISCFLSASKVYVASHFGYRFVKFEGGKGS